MTNEITHRPNGGMSVTGPEAVKLYAAVVLRSAIKMYVKFGIKASRFHTPTAMLANASVYTGKTYKRGQLPQAFDDLNTWIAEQKSNGTVKIVQQGES